MCECSCREAAGGGNTPHCVASQQHSVIRVRLFPLCPPTTPQPDPRPPQPNRAALRLGEDWGPPVRHLLRRVSKLLLGCDCETRRHFWPLCCQDLSSVASVHNRVSTRLWSLFCLHFRNKLSLAPRGEVLLSRSACWQKTREEKVNNSKFRV